jgi:hypothetical protein
MVTSLVASFGGPLVEGLLWIAVMLEQGSRLMMEKARRGVTFLGIRAFSMTVLELFWKAWHHPQQGYQSSPPEICVKKLQRDSQKYALQ